MLPNSEESWLTSFYPELKREIGGFRGRVCFGASYNAGTKMFQILYPGDADVVGGQRLEGVYEVAITEEPGEPSSLPRLTITGLGRDPRRHIGDDGVACLCSPFVEDDYLKPSFSIRTFIEELVVPFLYGQTFFGLQGGWPWVGYAHGITGLLESYKPSSSRERLDRCLKTLKHQGAGWRSLAKILSQRNPPSANTPCTCDRHHRIGHCHPSALHGMLLLREDVRIFRVQV